MTTRTTNGGWRKSSFSAQNGGCFEFRPRADGVEMRDSKDPDGPVLRFTRAELSELLQGVRAGDFDDLV